MKGIGQFIGFFLIVIPALVWKSWFGSTTKKVRRTEVPCKECSGTGKVNRDGTLYDCPMCGGCGILVAERWS